MRKFATIGLFVLIFYACVDDSINYADTLDHTLRENIKTYSPDGSVSYYILPQSTQLIDIPQDRSNLLSDEKVRLGQMLFYETGIATDAIHQEGIKTYSCASCHIPEAAFGAGRVQGIGDGGTAFGNRGESRTMHTTYSEDEIDIQGIRPLNLVNVAFVKNTFWNGQFGSGGVNIGTEARWSDDPGTVRNSWGLEAIETQNIEGLAVHRIKMDKTIAEHYNYTELFDSCFPEFERPERYSNMTASLAISAYIRTIVSDRAPFQEWLQGKSDAMNTMEKEGAILFFGKAKCSSCHYEKNLGSGEFHVLGVKDMDQHPEALANDPNDKRHLGRGGFTGQDDDMHKFKVPGLYNISDAAFYFHGSSKSTLEQVIRYKAKALRENPRIRQIEMSPKLHKLDLSDSEVERLEAFLSKSLRDPDMDRFETDIIHSGLCFPNNDEQSRIDLGCQ